MAGDTRPAVTRLQTTDSAILKTGEFGYPSGHLGHLTQQQEEALGAFRKLCQESGLYKPATDIDQNSHDDTTLLRFLRARRFDPQAALKQFSDTEKWREENKIGELYENIDINDYEETRVLYPQWTGRRDKRGIPVYVFEVAPLNSKTMSAYAKSSASTSVGKTTLKESSGSTPPRLLRLFALYENLTRFIMPLCSALKDRDNANTPISQSNNIVDISGVGLKQFWNLRSHMQDASQLATAHYPETLDRIFIIGAPSFFPTVWGWIKRWFDPITTSKIFILSEDKALRTLSAFIEMDNIPKKYGGNLPWEFGMRPILDPAEEQHIVWTSPDPVPSNQKWPVGPVKWITQKDGTMQAMAVGSVHGKERREIVATLHPDGIPRNEKEEATLQPPAPISDTRQSSQALPTASGIESAPNVPPKPEVGSASVPQASAQKEPESAPSVPPKSEPESVPVPQSSSQIDPEPAAAVNGATVQPLQAEPVGTSNGTLQKSDWVLPATQSIDPVQRPLPQQTKSEVVTLVNGQA